MKINLVMLMWICALAPSSQAQVPGSLYFPPTEEQLALRREEGLISNSIQQLIFLGNFEAAEIRVREAAVTRPRSFKHFEGGLLLWRRKYHEASTLYRENNGLDSAEEYRDFALAMLDRLPEEQKTGYLTWFRRNSGDRKWFETLPRGVTSSEVKAGWAMVAAKCATRNLGLTLAEVYYTRAIELLPDQPFARYKRGDARLEMRKYALALEDFRACLNGAPASARSGIQDNIAYCEAWIRHGG